MTAVDHQATSPRGEAPWTIGRILDWSKKFLEQRGSDTARLDAELLLAEAMGMSRVDLYINFERPLSAAEKDAFRGFLRRRAEGEPVAYVLGRRDFMGHSFKVGAGVLVPRPETEHLVELALERIPKDQSLRILDVGTGSGCIALSLALARNQAQVTAWDVSEAALALAQANAAQLQASVTFERRDALDPSQWVEGDPFDLIVSNPPYVTRAEMESLPKTVKDFEPHEALLGGDDGLAFYRMFATHAARRLTASGALLCEIGAAQGESVPALLREAGWRNVTVHLDYGRRPRVVSAEPPSGGG